MEQQQEGINRFILDPITRLQRLGDGDDHQEKHRLFIPDARRVDRRSVQYLVDFLHGDNHQVTELELWSFYLLEPLDGALDVLIDFFTNQTTLTKVKLTHSGFGSVEGALRLLAAVQSNRLVTDLAIYGILHLEHAEYGNCISDVLQNMPQLQRLELGNYVGAEIIRCFQPDLRTNRHLKELTVCACYLQDEGLGLIVDALVGNTTMEVLDISDNYDITSNGLDHITRLLALTRLKKINTEDIDGLFDDEHVVQHFAHVLHQHTSLEELPALDLDRFPVIKSLLDRNCSLRRAKELLALQPRTAMPIGSKSGIWYKAMEKLAPDSSGASSIFHILRTRPALLEKQLRRPAAVGNSMATDAVGGQKRRRL